MTEMVERAKAAIASVDLFMRFNDWTSDHVPGLPIEIVQPDPEGGDNMTVIARYPGASEYDGVQYLADHIAEAQARAVLEALREPTEAMLHIGGRIDAGLSSGRASAPYEDTARDVWQAMLSAAIGGK